MARQLRVEYPGAIYHVTVRMLGDWKRESNRLFADDADRQRFVESLQDRVKQYRVRLYLFVLMQNHFHLVLETPAGNCGKFMHSLTTAYTVYFNLRHKRHGHLVDGRYKAKLVEREEYLLKLTRYVHLNPVCVKGRANLPIKEKIRHLRSYAWSSYRSYIGLAKPLDYVEYGPILAEMHGQRRDWPQRYRAFVESGMAGSEDHFQEALKASPRCIGGEGFRAWVDERVEALMRRHMRLEDVAFRKTIKRLDPVAVMAELADAFDVPVEEFGKRRRDSVLRAVGARFLCRYAGLTQREAAGILGVGSGAAISHQAKKLCACMENDKKLKRTVEAIERRLDSRKR